MNEYHSYIHSTIILAVALIKKNQRLGHLYILLSVVIPLSMWLEASERWYQGLFMVSNIYLVSLLSYDDDRTTQDFYLVHAVNKIYRNLAKAIIIISLIAAQTVYLFLISPKPYYANNIALFFTLYLIFSHTAYALNGILSLGLTFASLFLSLATIFVLGVVVIPAYTYSSCIVWIINCVFLLCYLCYQLYYGTFWFRSNFWFVV